MTRDKRAGMGDMPSRADWDAAAGRPLSEALRIGADGIVLCNPDMWVLNPDWEDQTNFGWIYRWRYNSAGEQG